MMKVFCCMLLFSSPASLAFFTTTSTPNTAARRPIVIIPSTHWSSNCLQRTLEEQPQSHGRHLSNKADDNNDVSSPAAQEQQRGMVQPVDIPSGMEEGSHDELMYTLGVNLARQLGDVRALVEDGKELASIAKGLLDALVGRLTDDGQRALLQRRGKELNDLIVNRAEAIKERLASLGREMLETMTKEEGAAKLSTGVVVHILEPGPSGKIGVGTRPTKSSTVKIHYRGTLADGSVFDSTLDGDPVTFPLAGVIPGWRDAVLKMHEGETAVVGIPPAQGYGNEGTPDGRIPGQSTLFFQIQLLQVLTAGIGGEPTLLSARGEQLSRKSPGATLGLLGADGKPLA